MPDKQELSILENRINQLQAALKKKEQELKALAKKARKAQALVQCSPDSIVILDKDGIQTYVSDAVKKHLGYTPEEVTNIPVIEEMIHPDDRQKTLEAFRLIIEKGEGGVQHRHRHKDGSWVNLEAWGTNQLENPDIKGIVVNVRNITEWKKTQEALKESEEKYRRLVESSNDWIFETDDQGIYTYASPQVTELLGYKPEEMIGKSVLDILVPEEIERVKKIFTALFENPRPIKYFEKKCLHKNGSIVVLESNGVPIKDKKGRLVGFLGVKRDITQRALDEEEKIQARQTAAEQDKLALVGQIAGKMAHDFNNVLGVIMGNTELCLLDCREDETIKTLELILEQTQRGKNLTKNLVAFAKKNEPRQEFFGINEKIDLVINLMKKDLEGIAVKKESQPDIPEILADPGMMEHGLVNLIQNAIHAVSRTETPKIVLRTYSRADNIFIEIEDNGCGIPKEHINKIYEPSFTLKGSNDISGVYIEGIKGTGYGMANVKKYIKQHKGSIRVESQEGAGTRFTIRLPVIRKELTPQEKEQIREKLSYTGKYILLVEDETAILDVQYRILTHSPCNHKVDVANNGQMAIDMAQHNTYDFVSLDYILPGKINGMDVYNEIRKINKKVPILFISGNIEFLESIRRLKIQDPMIAHISKPCPNKDYVESINRLLKRSQD